MAGHTTSRVLNPLPLQGWAKIPAPRYLAIELVDQAGVYACSAFGPQFAGADTLLVWAQKTGVEVELIEWVREAQAGAIQGNIMSENGT